MRAGEPSVFVRFSGCNQTCKKETHGFDCDTEFVSGRSLTLEEIEVWCVRACMQAGLDMLVGQGKSTGFRSCPNWHTPWLVLTGGEPGLQVDNQFIDHFHDRGCRLAIETNGSVRLPLTDDGNDTRLDWITVSPKVAEHALQQLLAHEVKYVRGYGQAIPKTRVTADHYLISPAFDGSEVDPETMRWCINLCLQNPKWRLSVQAHKFWRVR